MTDNDNRDLTDVAVETTNTSATGSYTVPESEAKTPVDVTEKFNKNKKTKKVVGIILVILGLILSGCGTWKTFLAPEEEKAGTPTPAMEASTRGEYVTDTMSYMTDSVAYFTAAEDSYICLSIYDGPDDFHITPICINANDYDKYAAYLDWAYYADATEPEPMTLLGYSEVVDDELRQFISEGLEDFYGEAFTDEMYDYYVAPVYIVIGDARAQYYSYIASIVFYTLATIALIIGLYLLLVKPQTTEGAEGIITDYSFNSLPFGILGAIVGAAIGGVAWVLVGLAGVIVGYIGFLIFFLSILGYMAFCKDKVGFGIGLSCILSVVTVFAATITVTVLQVLNQMNDGSMGFVTFGTALSYTIGLLKNFEDSKSIWGNVAMGEIFVILGCIARASNARKNK